MTEPWPVLILCGGRGARLQEHTRAIPKPLVEIGGRPIVWHVVRMYAAAGFRDFVLLTGYRGELIERFVAAERWPADVRVRCLGTGEGTPTGGRIARAGELVDGQTFCCAYADGLADLQLTALADFHRAHGTAATMAVVQPALQFGVAQLNGDGVVRGFEEKPRLDRWINGGFFCFEPQVLELLDDDSVLEREPLERLAAAGQLRAYRHRGFWHCMDTYKDAVALDDLWSGGRAPWANWGTAAGGQRPAGHAEPLGGAGRLASGS